MEKLLMIYFLLFLDCGKEYKKPAIQNKTASERNTSNKLNDRSWSGNWIFTKKSLNSNSPEEQFTIKIIQNGENINAQYCAIANNGGKIDCESEKEYNFTGKIVNGKITGKFYSFFGSPKDLGNAEISFVSEDIINWKVIKAPKGEFYAPNDCNLNRDDKEQKKNIENLFPVTTQSSLSLNWIESDSFKNYNLIFSLPKYQNHLLTLAKNDLGIDESFALFSINETGKIIDSLAVGYSEDGYPENNSRYITEFSFNKEYKISLSKYKRNNYNNDIIHIRNYRISENGKFIKSSQLF